MNLELRQLRYFLVVAEELHFTRAAKRLHMAQPALSARIRELEQAVGTPLFRRSTRRVELTAAGEALLPHARETLAAAQRAREALTRATQGTTGPLRIGLVAGTQTPLTSRVLSSFSERYPEIRVDPIEHDFSDPSAGLRSRAVDIALVCAPLDETGLTLESLQQAALVAVVSERNPLAQREQIAVAELFDYPWPPPDTTDPVCRDFWLAIDRRTSPPRLGPATRSLDRLIQLLATGQAVTLAGDWTIPFFTRPGLAVIPVHDATPVTIALAWRTQDLTAQAARLVEVARDVCAKPTATSSRLHPHLGDTV
jgi:DNA-binding transcriptional LysR family regulator